MISRLDTVVGELIGHLEERGELDNTLVIFTSDNGGAAYTGATDNGPLRAGKFTQFEGGLAVPLLIRWPDGIGQTEERLVILSDLFATLLEDLSVPLPQDRVFDSAALQSTAADRHLFWRSDFNLAVRWRNWKLLHNSRNGLLQLYDLDADPGERASVANANPELVKSLLAALNAWEQELEDPRWPRVMDYLHQDSKGEYWFAI